MAKIAFPPFTLYAYSFTEFYYKFIPGINEILHTPRDVSVSSKYVLSLFDDGNSVIFPITPAVEGTGSPAVTGGAVAQHPPRVTSNSRRQELMKATLMICIVSYYSWEAWKRTLINCKNKDLEKWCSVNKILLCVTSIKLTT